MLCQNIEKEHGQLAIYKACQVINLSRHAYKHWQQQPTEKTNLLTKTIKQIAEDFPRYGYRRITAALRRRGFTANRKKVLKTMKEHCLTCKTKKRFRPKTTDSNHNLRIYSNLIKDLELTDLNQVWVSDITYIGLQQGFVYLAVVMDLYSRKCIGHKLSRDIDTELCVGALQKAIRLRKKFDLNGLIHHSDRGTQYASNEYIALLKEHGIQPSMSAKGYAYDNAHAESFIKTVKYDEVYMNEYRDFEDAGKNIGKFIEEVYNKKRLHSALGYKPPTEFEQKILKEERS